jgi:ribonuclease-3
LSIRNVFKRRSAADKKLYSSVKNILGFYPGNFDLYKLALTHKSVSQEIKTGVRESNERLEFLGDAILGAVVADYIYKRFPFKDEGFLTKLRSKMVSRVNINKLSTKLGIDQLIDSNIENERGAVSLKGDALEAFIGAIYVDKGYKKAYSFILDRLVRAHIDMEDMVNKDTDYKSKLIEYIQSEKKQLKYVVAEESGNSYNKLYVINAIIDSDLVGTGKGHSKKTAEQAASEEACKKLGI